jgi:polysaccharide deacetylase 2 family uncharacterized protein YibQ
MASLVRRRFRLPVLSRLAWAWMISATAALALFSYSLIAGDRVNGPTRVALALGSEVQHFAPPAEPKTHSVMPGKAGEAAPALREGAIPEEPSFSPKDDVFADNAPIVKTPDTDDEAADRLDQPGDIVITIDGAPARDPEARLVAPLAASYAPTVTIPDPDPALLQKSRFGMIPKIAADGRRAARYYARPTVTKGSAGRVALIVGGLGLNAELTARAIDELPPEVTLAFAPYAKNLEEWAARAREAGHEIMVELPMEAYGGGLDGLGPAALLTGRADADNLQRLDWLLSRFGGYFAATNYLGAKFSADHQSMETLLGFLDALGLAYIDDTGAAHRAAGERPRLATVDRLIAPGADGDNARAAARDLAALASIAERDGDALGKTYAYAASIDAILEWAKDLDENKVALAPASAVLQARTITR